MVHASHESEFKYMSIITNILPDGELCRYKFYNELSLKLIVGPHAEYFNSFGFFHTLHEPNINCLSLLKKPAGSFPEVS